MARILSIDYGAKRSGVAVTDSLQIIASPLKGLATKELLRFVDLYIQQEDVELIIIGYPTHKDGNPTYLCKDIDKFIKALRKNNNIPPIKKVGETNTSADASKLLAASHMKKKARMKKENLDMFSALIILRRYLRHD